MRFCQFRANLGKQAGDEKTNKQNMSRPNPEPAPRAKHEPHLPTLYNPTPTLLPVVRKERRWLAIDNLSCGTNAWFPHMTRGQRFFGKGMQKTWLRNPLTSSLCPDPRLPALNGSTRSFARSTPSSSPPRAAWLPLLTGYRAAIA